MSEQEITITLGLGAFLFVVGIVILITRRNLIMMLLGLELMLNAANLNLVAFNQKTNYLDGQLFALFVIVVAVCEEEKAAAAATAAATSTPPTKAPPPPPPTRSSPTSSAGRGPGSSTATATPLSPWNGTAGSTRWPPPTWVGPRWTTGPLARSSRRPSRRPCPLWGWGPRSRGQRDRSGFYEMGSPPLLGLRGSGGASTPPSPEIPGGRCRWSVLLPLAALAALATAAAAAVFIVSLLLILLLLLLFLLLRQTLLLSRGRWRRGRRR